jgi:hypothetical protein
MGNLSQHTKHRGVNHPRRHVPVIYKDRRGIPSWTVAVRWADTDRFYIASYPEDQFGSAVAHAASLCRLNTLLRAA